MSCDVLPGWNFQHAAELVYAGVGLTTLNFTCESIMTCAIAAYSRNPLSVMPYLHFNCISLKSSCIYHILGLLLRTFSATNSFACATREFIHFLGSLTTALQFSDLETSLDERYKSLNKSSVEQRNSPLQCQLTYKKAMSQSRPSLPTYSGSHSFRT